MTIYRLHQKLGELIAAGHGRKPVTIDKRTFTSPLERDGVVIMEVDSLEVCPVPQIDGDGFPKFRADGQECFRQCCILYGDDKETNDV